MCFQVNGLSNGQDFLIDIGVFAESLPTDVSESNSLAVGLRQGDQFVGFIRVGYYFDSLGSVISANVSGANLVGIHHWDTVIQNRPSNGIVQSSNLTAPHFNVKIAIYGSNDSDSGKFSVYAGTPDSPPYTFVWAAVEAQLDFSQTVDLCFYHKPESLQDPWTPDPTHQWKNISTTINGITFSVEKAEFGCDGQDLSNTTVDDCGVCGGLNECKGCDGVPHSGLVVDACGVCNGFNTSCCTDRFGISDSFWDWLLLPNIIEDVTQRLDTLSCQLTNTVSLLDGFSNLCNPVDPKLVSAFGDIDLDKYRKELGDFEYNCLSSLQTTVTHMLRDVSQFVPLNYYGK